MPRVSDIARATVLPALSLLSAMPTAWAADGPEKANSAAAREIELYQSLNRVLVMMRVGDGDLVPMVFDTGSDGATIERSLAERLQLKEIGQVRAVDGTTGNEQLLTEVAIPDVRLGGLEVGRIDAAVFDYDRNDAMGIVSSEMFTDSLLYLDLSNDRALLTPRNTSRLPAGAATEYVEGIPSTHIVLPDGSTLPAHFDTGYNAALSLPISMMNKIPLFDQAKVIGRFKSINTEGEVYGGRVRGTIKIGPVTLENPDVAFLGDLANIGLPIIRQITLVIDAVADRNWVLPAGAQPEPNNSPIP
jgi:predicted aspartyl protease